jgi:cytochrome P450
MSFMLAFWAAIGSLYTPKQDVQAVVKASEKQVSFYVALEHLAGKFLPNEDEKRDFATEKARKILSRDHGYGKPATQHFVFSLKPHKLNAWIPGMRETIVRHYFDALPTDTGTMDMFQFCFQLISGMTARVLLGNDVLAGDKFETVGKKWIQMVQEADIEQALEGGIRSLGTLVDVLLHGERKEFQECRDFFYPYVDAEMKQCLQTKGAEPNENDGPNYDYPVLAGIVRSTYKDCQQHETIFRSARTRIANDAILFTFAALTNSYGMAAWVLYYMLRNVDGVGDRIRQELQASPLDGNVGNHHHYHHFPELEATILEIGRLYTPGMVHRRIIKPGFTLPSTADVLHSIPT